MKRGPSHAGKLPAWERLAFGLVFALMAGFVVVVTTSAARSGAPAVAGRTGLPASVATPDGSGGGRAQQLAAAGARHGAHHGRRGRDAGLDQKLAAALQAVMRGDSGRVAVGVIDISTGAEAQFGARLRFRAGSIIRADILAALLLRNQRAGASLTGAEARLAGPMIESSDDKAANSLWRLIGAGPAVAAENARLGLSHTSMGHGRHWSTSTTTVADQLRLLTDLTSAGSPLTSASRDYELGLMEDVQPGRQWGVPAAASSGTGYAVKDGWLPDPVMWVINSIGVVLHDGHRLLIAVLSDGQVSKAAGFAATSAAAAAAARVVTQAS